MRKRSENDPWRDWSDLIVRRDYSRLANVLEFAKQRVSASDPTLNRAIEAIWHLSLACGRCRVESSQHRQGYVDARRREAVLREELRGALKQIGATLELSTQKAAENYREQRVLETRFAEPGMSEEPDASKGGGKSAMRATLVIRCLGAFGVQCGDHVVGHWPNTRAKSILKFLVTRRRRQPVSRETLMELFWPDATPQSARNSLNVALFCLRQTVVETRCAPLPVLFKDGCYCLNPDVPIWIDYEVFRAHIGKSIALERGGDQRGARQELETAEMLYRGDFSEEHHLENWLAPLGQSLRADYRRLLEKLGTGYLQVTDYDACLRVSSKMLGLDACDEEAHRRLMLCYEKRGLFHLALRQYQACVEALRRELKTSPSAETTLLAKRVRERRAS